MVSHNWSFLGSLAESVVEGGASAGGVVIVAGRGPHSAGGGDAVAVGHAGDCGKLIGLPTPARSTSGHHRVHISLGPATLPDPDWTTWTSVKLLPSSTSNTAGRPRD
ncbi:hypothetical protein ACFOY4_41515 [Actinomadura syzygii]|uniref:Uncharacterized protein n=1 Tax=Actinomadura syzygii TaxID=1427538 RepID=A0A5D0TP66_9ACTN|nr:hypothetical protein [Actinomadura syzygii]TYC07597.1 hypothetical protein FXF65_42110 [Actinomadura syzygii]